MEEVASQAGAAAAELASGTNQFVVFRLGENEFAVAIDQVQEILVLGRVTIIPKVPEFIEGVINVRGRIVPVLNLCKRLGIPGRPWDAETRIIVVAVAEQIVGMIVDMVTEVVRIPHATIEPPPPLITTVSPTFLVGIGKLESRILVILNLDRVLNPEELLELSVARAALAPSHDEARGARAHV